MPSTISLDALASHLLGQGDVTGAISAAEEGAARGDAPCLMLLAIWRLAGQPLARDLPLACAFLRRAVKVGHVDAALMEIALIANGSAAAPDWPRALALLRRAARNDPVAAVHLLLIDAMVLDHNGSPATLPPPDRLSDSPQVVLYRELLTPAECRHIAEVAQSSLEPAIVIDPNTGKMITHPVRTSHGTVIGPTKETLTIGAINRRVAAASGTHFQQGEPLAVLHYAPGQQYRPHFDSIAGARNQRIKTALIYLNQGYGGGETQFMANGLKVSGRTGDVVIFTNVLADGTPDPRSQHAGLPVTQGAKWLATRWIRESSYDPWYPS